VIWPRLGQALALSAAQVIRLGRRQLRAASAHHKSPASGRQLSDSRRALLFSRSGTCSGRLQTRASSTGVGAAHLGGKSNRPDAVHLALPLVTRPVCLSCSSSNDGRKADHHDHPAFPPCLRHKEPQMCLALTRRVLGLCVRLCETVNSAAVYQLAQMRPALAA